MKTYHTLYSCCSFFVCNIQISSQAKRKTQKRHWEYTLPSTIAWPRGLEELPLLISLHQFVPSKINAQRTTKDKLRMGSIFNIAFVQDRRSLATHYGLWTFVQIRVWPRRFQKIWYPISSAVITRPFSWNWFFFPLGPFVVTHCAYTTFQNMSKAGLARNTDRNISSKTVVSRQRTVVLN